MTIGIVGAGQLGQMMALAGYPLGLDFLFFDRNADTPAGRIAPLLAGAALVLAAFHGGQVNEEDNLHALGMWLDLRGAICR